MAKSKPIDLNKIAEIDKRIAKENKEAKTITNPDYKKPLSEVVKRLVKSKK